MRKISSISLLAVIGLLTALLLVACGDNTATTGTSTGATAAGTKASATTAAMAMSPGTAMAMTTSAAAMTTSAGGTTAAMTSVAATTSAAVTTAAASGTGKKIRVALVTDTGRIDDKSFNQSAYEGVVRAQKELGADIKYIETKDQKDYARNIKQFVDEKFDVIVTVGFLMGDATIEAAKANPTIKFIGVDQGQQATVANLAGLVFDEDKAGFQAGALAAGMSQKGKIAAVLGTKTVPAVVKFAEGYKLGAAYLDANYKSLVKAGKTEVILNYHADDNNTFSDPTWGAQQAQTLIQSGNDVIFGAGGGTGNGAVEAGASAGVYVIGVDTDQYLTLPKAQPKILSSATKLLTEGTFNLIKTAQDGSFKGGNNVGPTGLAPFHDTDKAIPQELKDALKKIESGLKDGTIQTGVKVG